MFNQNMKPAYRLFPPPRPPLVPLFLPPRFPKSTVRGFNAALGQPVFHLPLLDGQHSLSKPICLAASFFHFCIGPVRQAETTLTQVAL